MFYFKCIAKETWLIMKLMRQGCNVPHSQCTLSQDIRRWALKCSKENGPLTLLLSFWYVLTCLYQTSEVYCAKKTSEAYSSVT
jgi:hypothetical protein